MKALAASLTVVLLATGAQAQSLNQKDELGERCGKLAKERFASDWGSGIYSAFVTENLLPRVVLRHN
jgi:hypothetical protein